MLERSLEIAPGFLEVPEGDVEISIRGESVGIAPEHFSFGNRVELVNSGARARSHRNTERYIDVTHECRRHPATHFIRSDTRRPIPGRVSRPHRVTSRDRRLDVKARQLLAGTRRVNTGERLGNERAVPTRAVLLLNQEQASIVGEARRDARRVKAQKRSQGERGRGGRGLRLGEKAY